MYIYRFVVTPDVMIPRKSSECIVTTAVHWAVSCIGKSLLTLIDVDRSTSTLCSVLDLGTGSGCLLLSVLQSLLSKGFNANGVGIDLSDNALRVASKNAQALGLQEKCLLFSHSFYALESLLTRLLEYNGDDQNIHNNCGNGFDIITCNPPYSSIAEVSIFMEYFRCFVCACVLLSAYL